MIITPEQLAEWRRLAEALRLAHSHCNCGPRWTGLVDMQTGLPVGDGTMHVAGCPGAGPVREAMAPLQAHGPIAVPVLLDENERLANRVAELNALLWRVSQEAPLSSEAEDWPGQRARMMAEVGTLRAALEESKRELTASMESASRRVAETAHERDQARAEAAQAVVRAREVLAAAKQLPLRNIVEGPEVTMFLSVLSALVEEAEEGDGARVFLDRLAELAEAKP